MRILNDESDKKLNSVMLLLTREELKQLIGYSSQLIEEKADHCHLTNVDYQKEITICIYDAEASETFNPRVQKLIRDDE